MSHHASQVQFPVGIDAVSRLNHARAILRKDEENSVSHSDFTQKDSCDASVTALRAWLQSRQDSIKEHENKALAALRDSKDSNAYYQHMRERAQCIASLAEDGAALIAPLPADMREEMQTRLEAFAHGARAALRIDSVFYMSALLYPDEHKAGEPDNMERLIGELAGL